MTAWLKALMGRFSIRTQIVALVLLAQVLAYAGALAIILGVVSEERRDALRLSLVDGFAGALAVLEPDIGSGDPRLARLALRDPRVAILDALPLAAEPPERIGELIVEALPEGWAARAIVRSDPGTDWPGIIDAFGLGVRLSDGAWLWFTPQLDFRAHIFPQIAATSALLAAAVPLALLAAWAGTALIAPVRQLADSAQRFARDVRADPLNVQGPREVREATRAFNAMQARLRAMIDGRATTLASISHDMRTPLTRLRLRLDATDLGPAREGVDRDLAVLARMIDEGLEFMRSETRPLAFATLDLAALAEDAVAEAQLDCPAIELGPATESVSVRADADLTRRALDAVLENAARYAGGGRVTTGMTRDGRPRIVIADDGPGIPIDGRAAALRPFHRLQSVSRGGPSHTEGFGIGLPTAKEIMERQGGILVLSDTSPHGLTVTMIFERAL